MQNSIESYQKQNQTKTLDLNNPVSKKLPLRVSTTDHTDQAEEFLNLKMGF